MSEIHLERQDGVALITLDAPDRRNAITPQMARDLVAAFEAVDGDDAVGAVVVRATGKSFCAGAHLATLSEHDADPAGEEAYREIGGIYQSFLRLTRVKVPTIAAVQGAAVGAGLNLVLCADLRIVARDARLFSAFDKLGVHPGGGHFTLLLQSLGRQAATAVGIFGQELSGERAAQLGMAWEAAERDAVEGRAIELAGRVARDPALARAVIDTFRQEARGLALDSAVQVERAPQMWSFRREGHRTQ